MKNKYLSEVIQEHKEEILKNNDLILMTAGVGAGKNTWVQKELVKELNDDETILFITSRKMIKEQALKDRAFCDNFKICVENHYHFVTTHQKFIKMIINENDIYENLKKIEKLNFKYIVIDEVHSLIADSGFTDSTYYLTILINYFLVNNKKIICMSATSSTLSPYFKRFGNYKFFDFSNECYNVKPKEVEIINKEQAFSLLSHANSKNKMLYMSNSATDICKKISPKLIKDYNISKENIGILISDSRKDSLISKVKSNEKSILQEMDTLNNYIVDNEAFPENINIVLSTSKIREGVNLKDSNIKAMFCESHNPIDIIQFSGRYRKNIDKFYIIDNSLNQTTSEEITTMNIEYDFLNNILLENINLYYSVLLYKATSYINNFLKKYLAFHNTNITKLVNTMHFTNPVDNFINTLDRKNKQRNFSLKLKRNLKKYYTKSSKNTITLNNKMYTIELDNFKNFILKEFFLLRYNPIFEKYEIYNELYYYKIESFKAYEKYKENPISFIKNTLQVKSVLNCVPKFNIDTNKAQVRKEILNLLYNNNWINTRLDKQTQQIILDKIFNTILNKSYKQLGRLLTNYNISFTKPGANDKSYIFITG